MQTLRLITLTLLAGCATVLRAQSASQATDLAGRWQFIAANSGEEVAPGIFSSRIDTINFTAIPSADGQTLECHADSLVCRGSNVYPADWRMAVETDGSKHRVGWILTTEQPISNKEFTESRESYQEKGYWYWGSDDGSHRYIYLLAENVDATALLGMTFWSDWSETGVTSYSLQNTEHNTKKMTAVVATAIPYDNDHTVGYIETWASPKLVRKGDSEAAGIRDISMPSTADGPVYNLQGHRLAAPPRHGLYIRNGRKYLAR